MNLVMALPWIKISFKCYVGIQIPYIYKKQGSYMTAIDVCGIGMRLEKIEPGGRDHMLRGCQY